MQRLQPRPADQDHPHRLTRAPSFPELRLSSPSSPRTPPAAQTPTPTAATPTHRPHLHPLDLAASASKQQQAPRNQVPITPPLTPSSSLGGGGSPPEPPSPLDTTRLVRTFFHAPGEAKLHLAGYITPGHTSPLTDRSQSFASSNGDSSSRSIDLTDISDLSVTFSNQASLASLSDDEFTHEHNPDFSLDVGNDAVPSRFLLVGNVPANASGAVLKDAFIGCGDVKGILPRFQQAHGIVVLAFYDLRDAVRAQRFLSSGASPSFGGRTLAAKFIAAEDLEKFIGKSAFVEETDGELSVAVEDRTVDVHGLQATLSTFGTLKSFRQVAEQTYAVEYWDVRHASLAHNNLQGPRLRAFFGMQTPPAALSASPSLGRGRTMVHSILSAARDGSPSPLRPALPMTEPRPRRSGLLPLVHSKSTAADPDDDVPSPRRLFFDAHGKARPRSASADASGGSIDAPRVRVAVRETSRGIVAREDLFFDPTAPSFVPQQPEQPPQPAVSQPPEQEAYYWSPVASGVAVPSFDFGYGGYPTPTTPTADRMQHAYYYAPPAPAYYAPAPYTPTQAHYGGEYYAHAQAGVEHYGEAWSAPVPTTTDRYPPQVADRYPPQLVDRYVPQPSDRYPQPADRYPQPADRYRQPVDRYVPQPGDRYTPRVAARNASAAADLAGTADQYYSAFPPSAPVGSVPAQNQLNLAKIEAGIDTRTTVMIKNIPNKMSDRDLLDYINGVCPHRIDFFYLRMDFQNGCNVGYAFVNFISVQDLLLFAKSRLGVKWNLYSSEKVLQMSYANYQGKEALVEKFKNSCIMDERESWRPKIFFSGGPQEGLLEPFPPPTHLRRKERSSHNRGALYVPGTGDAERARRR